MDAVLDIQAPGAPLDYEAETVPVEQASHENLFGDAGQSVRRVKESAQYLRRLARLADITDRAFRSGEVGPLKEAMQTSDFPLLFGDIMDRQMLGRYEEFLPDWRSIARVSTVRDFRTVKRFGTDGMEGALNSVGEQKQYPKAVLKEDSYSLTVSKYGRMTSFSWEAMINDDFGALQDAPERFARGARRTEARAVTTLYTDANGPHASLYTVANKNIINTTNGATQTNPPLNILGLQDGMAVLGRMLDEDGEPILMEMVYLVVPPALEVVARNILNATSLWLGGLGQTGGGGAAAQGVQVNNWMRQRLQLIVDPYIPIIASSANTNTSWFLFAAASTGRPALEVAFLRGYERPQIFIKESNQRRIGGAVNGLDGDFDFDTIWYKVRHVLGTARNTVGGFKSTVASNGSGS